MAPHFNDASAACIGLSRRRAASTRETASEEIMIRRRDVPLAVAAQGLAIWSGSAFGQTKGLERKEARTAPPPVRADERVNQVLAPVRDEHHLPGLIGAILTGNRLAAIGALGIRKIGSPEPIRVTDQMHLGSCTKAMTATMIGTLIDEGKLSGETTIRQVFPEVAPQLHPDFQAVTLRQLLTHRAGLPANGPWWRLSGKTTTEKRRDLLVRMLSEAPRSRPGSTLCLLQRRLCPGRADGRASDGRIVGDLDAPAVVRAAGDGFRGVWNAGRPGSSRPALGPSPVGKRDQADAARQRAGAGTGRHRPLHRTRLGQVRRASPSWCAEKGQATETGHVPGPPYASAG